ncbi:hypothetical protein NDU88_000745 [Pleurodeles waltl]|uniref:Uncharacterized protein n=1 Tax=Pleurodeles waltl TaxID=8319 RepID=A0AAV7U544_PLEWA|nr:hypothetical protein NDU88_000745 [Pleurodeles waltl]
MSSREPAGPSSYLQSGLRRPTLVRAAPASSSHAPSRYHGVPLGRLHAITRIHSDPDGLERTVAAPEARRRRPR